MEIRDRACAAERSDPAFGGLCVERGGAQLKKTAHGGRRMGLGDFMKKTALVLSGGGSRGAYQMGVWQALREMGIPIHMVAGTSVGAINGAAVSQDAFAEAGDLWRSLNTTKVFDFSQLFQKGGASYTDLKEMLQSHLSEDAIRASAIDYGLVAVEIVKNGGFEAKYLWKEDIPQGRMIDYILASASCFPAVTPYEIGGGSFIDGGYRDNLPIGMVLDRGADTIIAVNLNAMGIVREEDVQRAQAENRELIVIQSHWDLGNFLIFDQDYAQYLMRLGYLDGLKAFGAYEGVRYAFLRGEMDRRTLSTAEEAGEIFGLDPQIIYSKKIFLARLADKIEEQRRKKPSFMGFLELKGLKKDLRNLKAMGKAWSLDGLRQMQGIRADICDIRAQLLVTKMSAVVPSEARVLRFLEKEGLL